MSQIQIWFNELVKISAAQLVIKEKTYLYYKGFRISEDTIEDTRYSDFYSSVTPADLVLLNDLGIVKGCDFLVYRRNVTRVALYQKRIDSLEEKLKDFSAKLINKPGDAFLTKRIRNCNEALEVLHETLSYYTAQMLSIKHKYNFN